MPLTPCAKNIVYRPATCSVKPGGVAQIAIFDSTLFDFTQASPVSGVPQPYTAITDLGTSTKMYPVQFTRMKARYTFDQKNTDGTAPMYQHNVEFPVPDINMLTEQWSVLIDQQGYCCGVGIVIILNSGRALIMGENSVNGSALAVPFYVYQDGSKSDSGQKMDDQNANTVKLTGACNRPLIEYTGAISTLTALFA